MCGEWLKKKFRFCLFKWEKGCYLCDPEGVGDREIRVWLAGDYEVGY